MGSTWPQPSLAVSATVNPEIRIPVASSLRLVVGWEIILLEVQLSVRFKSAKMHASKSGVCNCGSFDTFRSQLSQLNALGTQSA